MDDTATGMTDRDADPSPDSRRTPGRGIIGRVAPLLGVAFVVIAAAVAARSDDLGLIVVGRGALGARLLVGAFGLTVVVGLGIWVLGARSPLARVVGTFLFALTLFGLIWWIESDEALDEPPAPVEEVREDLGAPAPAQPGRGEPVLDTGGLLFTGGLVVATLAAFLAHRLISRPRRAGPGSPVTSGSPSSATLGTQIADTARGAAEDLLTSQDPSIVVLRSWLAFEDLLEDHGVTRDPGRTSREYVRTALLSIGAGTNNARVIDTNAVDDLAGLYDQAMYSSRRMGRAEAERAAAALRRIADGLRAGTAAS